MEGFVQLEAQVFLFGTNKMALWHICHNLWYSLPHSQILYREQSFLNEGLLSLQIKQSLSLISSL